MHSHLRKETSEILFSSSTVPRHFTPNAGRMDNAVDQVRHALTVGRSGPRRLHSCGVGLVESPSVSVVKSWSIPPDRLSYQGGKVMTAPAEHDQSPQCACRARQDQAPPLAMMWNTNPSTVIPTATAAIGSRTSAVALAPLTGPVQVSNSPTAQS